MRKRKYLPRFTTPVRLLTLFASLRFCVFAFIFFSQVLSATQACQKIQRKDAEGQSRKENTGPLIPGQDCGAIALIEFHQKILSESDGPRSHFYPSSSEYTKQAITRYGIFTGIALGCDRLLRENSDLGMYPLTTLKSGITLKFDPVPREAGLTEHLQFDLLEELAASLH